MHCNKNAHCSKNIKQYLTRAMCQQAILAETLHKIIMTLTIK